MGLFNSPVAAAGTIFSAMKRLFKLDEVTGGASVQLWVVMSTLLLVIRFLVESSGTRVYSGRFTTSVVVILALLNYNMVDYTIGLMQLSAARVNDYFQVWAVLLATLQCSVNVGCPYSRSRRIPLLDIMSSFWAANLLRVQTVSDLKIPLWLIWSLNTARVVSYFLSSDKADEGNQGNTRLVADYMRYEHTLSAGDSGNACSSTSWYRYDYLVHGEDKVSRKIQQQPSAGPGSYRVRLKPQINKDLITVEKIWAVGGGGGERGLLGVENTRAVGGGDGKSGMLGVEKTWGPGESCLLGMTRDSRNRLKDVCLSFALHKLLRRRFYDLPIHEATVVAARDKTRQLVFEYILEKTENYERAFRVTEVELSFLRDTFYHRHAAAMFTGGFPLLRIILSLSLILAIGYIAYPVRHIPLRVDPNDKNRTVHGVFVTRLLIALIVAKELWEVYIYVFAPWTKVQMICMYVKHPCLQRPLAEKFWRLLLWFMPTRKWNRRIRQYNLLISAQNTRNTSKVKLRAEVQKAIFDSLRLLLEHKQKLESYISNAFGSNQDLCSNLEQRTCELEADTHRILLWHIATGVCELELLDKDARQRQTYRSEPLIKESKLRKGLWPHYITAVSLSNYCAYLLTERMVPENGLVAERVFNAVCGETKVAIFNHDRRVRLQGIRAILKAIAALKYEKSAPDEAPVRENQQLDGAGAATTASEGQIIAGSRTTEEDDEEEEYDEEEYDEEGNSRNIDKGLVVNEEPLHNEETSNGGPDGDNFSFKDTIVKMGSELGEQLIKEYTEEDQEGLWRDLAKFWTGFLLHLAASTRAAKHKNHLPTNGELITHLWALLSHAGYVGNVGHGHQILDPEDLNDVDPLN